MGIVITANHLEMVLVNLGYEIEKIQRVRLKFSTDLTYCTEVAEQVRQFIHNCETDTTILGIGIAIPGIIDQKEKMVIKSHALQIENYSLRFLEQALDALQNEAINKVALLVFNRNEAGNAFWERQGFTARDDVRYRNKALTEIIRIDT